jgi:hypothetical protein
VATPLQQAKCELLAFPWTPDVLAMCNLLAAQSASDMAVDTKQGFVPQKGGQQTPFNRLLMPELASLQDGARSAPQCLHTPDLAVGCGARPALAPECLRTPDLETGHALHMRDC